MQDDIIVDPMESPEIVDDPFQTIRANLTSADMRESDFSGSTFNGAYMEKVVTYKANFEGRAWWHVLWVGVCTAGEAVEPWVKKMGPNSELRSSSLKIRRKHFLSTRFWHLSKMTFLSLLFDRNVSISSGSRAPDIHASSASLRCRRVAWFQEFSSLPFWISILIPASQKLFVL
ncbi:hypothetical protein FF1_030599 [Malus domestica]